LVTNVLSPVERSPAGHLALDLEPNSISVQLRWVLEALLVNVPLLVDHAVALPPDEWLVLLVGAALDVHAHLLVVLDMAFLGVPSDPLGVVSLVDSGHN